MYEEYGYLVGEFVVSSYDRINRIDFGNNKARVSLVTSAEPNPRTSPGDVYVGKLSLDRSEPRFWFSYEETVAFRLTTDAKPTSFWIRYS